MSENKLSIRPVLKNVIISGNRTPEEKFQNTTLRPILKLQHELLIAFFKNHLLSKRVDFSELNTLKKRELVDKVFSNDPKFKNEIRGMILGHFTVEEYRNYLAIAQDVNKRMMSMLRERIKSAV